MMGQTPFESSIYSIDVNGAHILTFSVLESFFEQTQIGKQLEWLENDLIKANKNRHLVPWIVVLLPNRLECLVSDLKCQMDKRDYYFKRLV
jgi:hypothetical protein